MTHHAAGVPRPALATRRSAPSANAMIGRVAASAMITTTKSGLGVVDLVVEVVLRRFPADVDDHRREEHDRPEAEHDFDFAEKVQELGRDARRLTPALGAGALIVAVLNRVRQRRKAGRRERVEDGQQEDRRWRCR